jgi:uncharacterized protein (DUF2164 family)
MAITIPGQARRKLIASIRRYFDEKLDEEIGELKAALLLDYVLAEIGPTVYNQAIADAQAFFQDKVSDLEGACYESEFVFWK